MKKWFSVLCLSLLCVISPVSAVIRVNVPDAFELTTRQGLALQISNNLEGVLNNDAVSYLVISGRNKSREKVEFGPEQFILRDQTGTAIPCLAGVEALRTLVDYNYNQAKDYVRFGDADLRDVLRTANRRYTDKELKTVKLEPNEELKDKVIFFPKLATGKYTLEFGKDKVNIRVTDGVYFVRPESLSENTPQKSGASR